MNKNENKELILKLGFEYGGDLIPKNLENDKRCIKVNLPDNLQDYESGNGEGVWAYLINEEDLEKYNTGIDTFDVVLLNPSIYYYNILRWGSIIQVEGRGTENRPVLNIHWFDKKIKSN